jgi:small subunit ribosomal protein S11
MAKEPAKEPVEEKEAAVTEEAAVADATAETTTETPANETGTTAEGTEPTAKPRKKKNRRTVTSGQIHVLATFNNTIITITDEKGNTLATASASAGASGFRGSKKGTAYAAQIAAEKAVGAARQNYGLTKADVFVKGVGMGRDAAIRTLVSQKVQLDNIKDVTGIPHGGVRPRRPKRN